mgnify:CR=1 FL=1
MKDKLIQIASDLVGELSLNSYKKNDSRHVACALLTKDGNIHTGVNLTLACAIGFCAETAAVAEMLKHRETEIEMIVAVKHGGKIIPPCGRCREMLMQVDKRNLHNTKVIVSKDEVRLLSELLPSPWLDYV